MYKGSWALPVQEGLWTQLPLALSSLALLSGSTESLARSLMETPLTPLFLQFHHVPLYLEWAPIGVFGAAPEKKESQPEQPAEKAEVEQENGESRIWGHRAVGSTGRRVGLRGGHH